MDHHLDDEEDEEQWMNGWLTDATTVASTLNRSNRLSFSGEKSCRRESKGFRLHHHLLYLWSLTRVPKNWQGKKGMRSIRRDKKR